MDLSKVNFHNIDIKGADFSYTNVYIDPQKLKYYEDDAFEVSLYKKRLDNVNLEGVDMSGKDFTGVSINNTNLKNTNANIDPQTVFLQDLTKSNLEGLDLSNKDFDCVRIFDTHFEGANIEGANFIGAYGIETAYFDKEQYEYIKKQFDDYLDKTNNTNLSNERKSVINALKEIEIKLINALNSNIENTTENTTKRH